MHVKFDKKYNYKVFSRDLFMIRCNRLETEHFSKISERSYFSDIVYQLLLVKHSFIMHYFYKNIKYILTIF